MKESAVVKRMREALEAKRKADEEAQRLEEARVRAEEEEIKKLEEEVGNTGGFGDEVETIQKLKSIRSMFRSVCPICITLLSNTRFLLEKESYHHQLILIRSVHHSSPYHSHMTR